MLKLNKIYVKSILLNDLVKALSGTTAKLESCYGRNTELLMHTRQGSDVLTVNSRADMGPGRVYCNLPCVKTFDAEMRFTISIESLKTGLHKLGNSDAFNISGCFEFDSDGDIFLFYAVDEEIFCNETRFYDLKERAPYKIITDKYESSVTYVAGEITTGDIKFPAFRELVGKLEQVFAIAKLVSKTSKTVILFHFSTEGLVLKLQSPAVMASVKLLDKDFNQDFLRVMDFNAFRCLKEVLVEFRKASREQSHISVAKHWFTIKQGRFYIQVPLICPSEIFIEEEPRSIPGDAVEFCTRSLQRFIHELKISKALSDEFATLYFIDNALQGSATTEINSTQDVLYAIAHVEIDSAPFDIRRDLLDVSLNLFGAKMVSVAGLGRHSDFLKLSSSSTDHYLIVSKMPTPDDVY